MSNECAQNLNSTSPIVECSESDVKISSNVQRAEPGEIKHEPTDRLDNTQNSGSFEFVELKIERNTLGAIDLKVEEKIETEEPADCKNLRQTPLKIGLDQTHIDSNMQSEELVGKVKREHTDNLGNQSNIQDGKWNPEQSGTSSSIELEVEEKVDIEERADYKNLFETSLKTDPHQTNINRASDPKNRLKNPKTKTRDIIKSQLFHCKHCDHVSKLKTNLTKHINRIHLKIQPHQCDICRFQCADNISLKRHKSSHSKKCTYCDYIGLNQGALSAHKIANHGIKHKCRFCDYVTKYRRHLNMHENGIHLKNEKFACPDCTYTTLYKSNMWIHKKRKHDKICFNCDKCDYKTKTQECLKRHISKIHPTLHEKSCGYCDYTTTMKSHLKRHINGIHLKIQPYKCDICSFQCVEKIGLKRHMSSHSKKCNYCDYVAIKQEEIWAHRIANHGINHKCRFCDYVAKNKADLIVHENGIHLKKERYACPDCSYTTLYKSNMWIHKKRKHVNKTKTQECRPLNKNNTNHIEHKCRFCDYTAKFKWLLETHENGIHLRKERYSCPDCSYTALYKSNMWIHKKRKHGETYVNCDKTKAQEYLKRHINAIHSTIDEKSQIFHCEHCDYTTKRKDALKRHINGVHLKNYLYKCDICSFRFPFEISLKRHKSTHFKKCTYCDYVGIDKKALLAHRIANHSKCRFCDYTSKRKLLVEDHENAIHLKKPIYCEHCDYKCAAKASMAVHLRKNHAHILSFKCEKCDFTCKERSKLIRHLKVEHDKNYKFECNDCGFLAKTKLKLEDHILASHFKQIRFQCKFCPYGAFTKVRVFEHAKAKHKEAFVENESLKEEFVFWIELSL